MATNGNRGRGRGGGPGGGGNRGGDPGTRRGSWRAGPPGSGGFNSNGPRTGTPGNGSAAGTPPAGPRQSINDHMNDMKRAQQDKAAKSFQTDTEISHANNPNKQRELQKWQADPAVAGKEAGGNGNGHGSGPAAGAGAEEVAPNGTGSSKPGKAMDAETFGGAAGGKWDQFETNSRLFGTQTSYQEELYTTKLNKSGPDFKAREKEAEKLAAEIMGQTSGNFHIMEERGGAINWADDVDEEEKYSGVVRNPNAYVPPGARKGGYAAAAGRSPAPPTAQAPKANGQVPLNGGANGKNTPLNAPGKGAATGAKSPGPSASPLPPKPATPVEAPKKTASPAPSAPIADKATLSADKVAKAPSPAPTAVPAPAAVPAVPEAKSPAPPTAGVSPNTAAAALADGTDPSQITNVVGAYRQFVEVEREKVVAKKQSIAKSEREKQLAELKKFQASFKVPLPMPKDILPILAKDEEKQKAIEAKAESSLQAARVASTSKKTADVKSPDLGKKSSKKIQMSIAEIPPFNPNKAKPSPAVVPLPISESARENIATDGKSPAAKAGALSAVSAGGVPAVAATAESAAAPKPTPTPAEGSLAARLNPKASAFVFKPNANAPAFKPGQPSSPSASVIARITSPAGPSTNPFFGDDVPRTGNDIRADFNPHRTARGQLPMANVIAPNWPYTGRPVQINFSMGPQLPQGTYMMPDDENSQYGRPPQMGMPMQGMHPQMRYNQPAGMPNMNMQANPMFSPGPGGGPMPPNGYGQVAGGMPLSVGGYPPQQFMGPQGMFFSPIPNGGANGNGNGPPPNGMPGPGPGQGIPGGPGGPNGPGQFMPPQHNGPPGHNHGHGHGHGPSHGHFAGPASPTARSMHHQQMQSMGGASMYPFQQGPPGVAGSHGPSGPGSASASSQGHPHGQAGSGSQIGTPMQTPQMQHANPYPSQTPFQQPSPAPPSIPQMPHP